MATGLLRRKDPATIKCFNLGISDGSTTEAAFTFYNNAAGWSTMRPDNQETEENMEVFLNGKALSSTSLGPLPLRLLGQALRFLAPPRLFQAVVQFSVRRLMQSCVQVTCHLSSVSKIMRQEGISRIDLLKVDVERAEMDVLLGIEPSDWPKIHQLVLEVHDVKGRLLKVMKLLESKQFAQVTVQQSTDLQGSSLYNVYAIRT